MKKIILTLILLLMMGCSNGGNSNGGDPLARLMQMESYKATAEVTYISNKGEQVFATEQFALKDGRYRIDTVGEDGGTSLIYDGKLVWQKSNSDGENKIKVTSNSPERSLLLLYSFLENHSKSMENATVTTSAPLGKENFTILDAIIPSGNKFLASEKLWINGESGNPEKLIVYTADGKEKIVVKFSNFKYNESIDDSIFSVN